ncbi:MAG: phage/plasmid primase, P4 family, partial [Caldisericota bacterium]|nr:phage/plasmid primase, P4 family [Caldisericota bacterium]
MQRKNTPANIKVSSQRKGVTFRCLRCGAEVELPDTPLFRVKGFCKECNRDTIFEKVEAEPPIELFFENKEFIPKKLADFIMEDYRFITFGDTDELYTYERGIYRSGGENLVKSLCEKYLGKENSTYRTNEVVNHIKRGTYTSRDKIADNIELLCIANGILNVKTLELLPHTPDIIFLNKIPVNYNPDADCPKIKQFFKEVCYPEDIPTMRELFGYCLYRDYPIHRAAMFIGEGSNGKSKTIGLLRKFLGQENVSSKELRELVSDRFATIELYGKMANVCAEITADALRRTGIFKALTGQDLITAARKFKGSFSFENYAKLIFSANKLPMSSDKSYAFYRRWILLSFPNTFEGDRADPNILEKLATPEELSGLLNWALNGLDRLLKNGDFTYGKTVEEVQEQYESLSDPVYAYVKEFLKVEIGEVIVKDELYEHYVKWCRERKLPVTAKNMLTKELSKHLPEMRTDYI